MIKLIDILTEAKIRPGNTGMKKFFYLFVDGEGNLKINDKKFENFILSNINKIKSLWADEGWDWDDNNITQDKIDQAIRRTLQTFPTTLNHNTGTIGKINPKMNIKDFSKKDEDALIQTFLSTLYYITV